MLLLVWMADIAAYFGGKALGRRKLAPTISPGKSWEGAVSGLLGVFLLAAVWLWADAQGTSLYARLWALGPLWAVLSLAFLGRLITAVGPLATTISMGSQNRMDTRLRRILGQAQRIAAPNTAPLITRTAVQ